jgi:mannosyltransferase OCH1-like enzyme
MKNQIPKIIHYVWFGGEKDEKTKGCIESWERFLEGFEIIEWNEKNSPLEEPYLKKALELKNYSNISNFIRLWAVKKFGGIYFDADFELIKEINFFHDVTAFISFESDDLFVNNAIFGAIKEHHFTVDCYKELLSKFDGSELSNLSGPILATDILKKYGLSVNTKQILNDVLILPRDVFHPYGADKYFLYSCLTENTYGIHHWQKSWIIKEQQDKADRLSSKYFSILNGQADLKLYIKLFINYLKNKIA